MIDASPEYTYTTYNTIQYNTIQYNTIQYNTIQYNMYLSKTCVILKHLSVLS